MTSIINVGTVAGAIANTDDGAGDNGVSFRQYLATTILTAVAGSNQFQGIFIWGKLSGTGVISLAYAGQMTENANGTSGPAWSTTPTQLTFSSATTLASPQSSFNTISAATINGTSFVTTTGSTSFTSLINTRYISNQGSDAPYGYIVSKTNATTFFLSQDNGALGAGLAVFAMPCSVSDTATLNENFDATHAYGVAWDVSNTNSAGLSLARSALASYAGTDMWFVSSAAGTLANQITPTGTWTKQAGRDSFVGQINITGGSGVITGTNHFLSIMGVGM